MPKELLNSSMYLLLNWCAMGEVRGSGEKQYITNDINPFYKSTEDEVMKDRDYAEECYKKVHKHYTCFYYNKRGTMPKIPPILFRRVSCQKS